MIDNVGEMPLDIFSDYINDILNQEWSWEYLICIYGFGTSEVGSYRRELGNGYSYWYGSENGFGSGVLNLGIRPKAENGCGIVFLYHIYSRGFSALGEGESKFKEDDYD
jgi:hypothetical protein